MPEIGETRSAKEFGLNPKTQHRKVYVQCPVCEVLRWVNSASAKRINFTGRCHSCNAKYRGGYRIKKGGRWVNNLGYVLILLQPDDFFYSMAGKDGYVFEHRLVVAKAIGRCLHSWEIVHHKDGCAKADNRYPETLQLVSDLGHKQITILENRITNLERRITLLEAENAALRERTGQQI